MVQIRAQAVSDFLLQYDNSLFFFVSELMELHNCCSSSSPPAICTAILLSNAATYPTSAVTSAVCVRARLALRAADHCCCEASALLSMCCLNLRLGRHLAAHCCCKASAVPWSSGCHTSPGPPHCVTPASGMGLHCCVCAACAD